MRQGLLAAGLALLMAGTARAGSPAPSAPDFGICEKAVREHPERKESFRCFWEVAHTRKAWDEAARRLEAHLALDPGNPRARLSLAAVEWDRGSDRTEPLYRGAAEGFAAIGDRNGEVFSWMGLAGFLRQRGRPVEAEPILERALASARESGDPTLVARVRIDQTVQAFARADFGEALRFLREAEAIARATGSAELRARVLADKGYAFWAMGLYRKSIQAYSAQADLLREIGAPFELAAACQSIADLANTLRGVGQMEEQEVVRLEREALDAAVRSGNRAVEGSARVMLSHHLEPRAAIAELERALTLSRAAGERREARFALRQLAVCGLLAAPDRPDEAFRRIREAADDARSSGDLEDEARALLLQAAMRHRVGTRERFIEDSEASLDTIERIRDLQPEETVRARVFAPWASAYSIFAGRLLDRLDASPDPAGDLDLAFSTLERMRARTLLDELEQAGTRPRLDPSDPDLRRRAEILREISRIQRTLLDGDLGDAGRRSAIESLDRLEEEEAALRDAIARRVPEFARWHPAGFPGLAAVQARLDPDQALLSYTLAPGSGHEERLSDPGEAWVVLVTHDRARAFRLPERSLIEDRVTMFLGLCRRGDGSEARAGARLFADLLAPALSEAGPSIGRLVIVPDAALNRLPFAALREDADGPPVAVRYEIELAASAALWLRCKETSTAGPAPAEALILADPEPAALPASAATRTSNPWIAPLGLGRLPQARREARAIARELGPGTRVLIGREASEEALTRADLRGYGLVHLAAHAVADEAHPERSAVILSPGGAGEDGLLQIREIVALPLAGRVVVLSACRSASGAELAGEGVLSLARAFLQAGARAVVATLWQVRDEDAASFAGSFARALGSGLSLAAANAAAEREAILAGRPVEAWGGTVVLGDGDFILRPGGVSPVGLVEPWLAAFAIALIAAIGLGIARWRRRRRLGPPL